MIKNVIGGSLILSQHYGYSTDMDFELFNVILLPAYRYTIYCCFVFSWFVLMISKAGYVAGLVCH